MVDLTASIPILYRSVEDHKRSKPTADREMPVQSTSGKRHRESVHVPAPRRLKKDKVGLRPECDTLRRILEGTKDAKSLYFDWTLTGCNTYEEYLILSKYVTDNMLDPLLLHEFGTFMLSSPFLHIHHGDLTHTEMEEAPEQRTPENRKSTGTTTRCSQTIGPICFKRTGDWLTRDLVRDLNNAQDGLLRYLEDNQEYVASLKDYMVLSNERFDIDSYTEESDVNNNLKDSCLNKLAKLLRVSGHHIEVKTTLRPRDVLGGAVGARTQRSYADSFLVIGPKGKCFPILSVKVMKPLMDYLVHCLEWHRCYELGILLPGRQPTRGEITQCVKVMTQLLQHCLGYGVEEVVLWDGVTATAINFDLDPIHKRVGRVKRVRPFAKKDSEVPTVAVVSFVSRTVSYKDKEMPVTYMLAAMAWRQVRFLDDKDAYEARRIKIADFCDKIYLPTWSISEIESSLQNKRDNARKSQSHRNRYVGSGKHRRVNSTELTASGVGRRVTKIDYEPLQEGDYMRLVMRLNTEQRMNLFRSHKIHDESVVVKILDVGSVERYYDVHRRDDLDLMAMEYEEFFEICEDEIQVEFECYKRIARFNRISERKIHAPKMLDYGYCCFEDDYKKFIMGLYMMLEDLGDCEPPPEGDETIQKKIDEQLELLESIGIVHGDVAPRNLALKDGEVYIFDFGRAELSEASNIFV